jgi:hypothetical protein
LLDAFKQLFAGNFVAHVGLPQLLGFTWNDATTSLYHVAVKSSLWANSAKKNTSRRRGASTYRELDGKPFGLWKEPPVESQKGNFRCNTSGFYQTDRSLRKWNSGLMPNGGRTHRTSRRMNRPRQPSWLIAP